MGGLLRVFHQGNVLRDTLLADPRHAEVNVAMLVEHGLGEQTDLDAGRAGSAEVPRGDTVGVAAADSDGYAVSLIQSVYHAFGSGLIDPATGILFHNRGTSFSLDPASPNVIAPRKRPAHTLMPVLTLHHGEVRHVLATMGGQGQPQILGQVLLRALAGASAETAVTAPRAVVGMQVDGATADSVTVESDVSPSAESAIRASGLPAKLVPPHTDAMGHTNVVFIDESGSMTAASDPRSDGAAVVTH
jgi:gamma-glutamyltranspeptidase/glutathione hydrolase